MIFFSKVSISFCFFARVSSLRFHSDSASVFLASHSCFSFSWVACMASSSFRSAFVRSLSSFHASTSCSHSIRCCSCWFHFFSSSLLVSSQDSFSCSHVRRRRASVSSHCFFSFSIDSSMHRFSFSHSICFCSLSSHAFLWVCFSRSHVSCWCSSSAIFRCKFARSASTTCICSRSASSCCFHVASTSFLARRSRCSSDCASRSLSFQRASADRQRASSRSHSSNAEAMDAHCISSDPSASSTSPRIAFEARATHLSLGDVQTRRQIFGFDARDRACADDGAFSVELRPCRRHPAHAATLRLVATCALHVDAPHV
mmetsp:Transcript_10421/g.63691  ORF Transcript_10421/g.63691 Transcript_10421/m.63691 type:complete len:315 (+) Transcript_10421:2532-3476(+)